MTATLERAPGRKWNRHTEPSPWIGCPACGVTTIEVGAHGWFRLLHTASGAGDGARCRTHSRTLEQREHESERAVRIALYRPVLPYPFGSGGWVAIDDTAQGTE